MSPTVLLLGRYRLYFYSREEPRMHIHVQAPDGEAKFWLEPKIELAQTRGLDVRQLHRLHQLIEEHADDIRAAWSRHFGSYRD